TAPAWSNCKSEARNGARKNTRVKLVGHGVSSPLAPEGARGKTLVLLNPRSPAACLPPLFQAVLARLVVLLLGQAKCPRPVLGVAALPQLVCEDHLPRLRVNADQVQVKQCADISAQEQSVAPLQGAADGIAGDECHFQRRLAIVAGDGTASAVGL